MTAANDSVDPIDPQTEHKLRDLPVPDQSSDEIVGGSTMISADAELVEAMQMENLQYSSISNVLKTKHDTAKNSINNIR